MNNYIDLHGMTEEEIIGPVMMALADLEESYGGELEIVTGKGGTLQRAVEEILEDEGWTWEHKNGNYGSYIIKK